MQDKGKHYVYVCYVEGELRYVGIGKGHRYKHCTSGTSSCSELNRDFHAGKDMRVEIIHENLTESDALLKESHMIRESFDQLYNKVIYQNKFSIPNCKKSKTMKVVCSSWSIEDDEVKFKECLMDMMGIDTDSNFYNSMICGLIEKDLAIYVVETPTKTKMIVIDKADEIEREKSLAKSFAHLAHPEGLYSWRIGLDMAMGVY